MKGKKLLSFVLVLAMILVPLSISVSAATPTDCLTLDQIGSTYSLQSGFNVSDFGTATVDGKLDAVYSEFSHVRSNHLGSNTDAQLDVYYANDKNYLYAYAIVKLPTGYDIDGTDLIRFYIDFYNKHEGVLFVENGASTYQQTYLNGDGYNGGQFQFNANDASFSGGRGASGKVAEHKVIKTYSDSAQKNVSGYIVEAKITLPDYVKSAINANKAPVISVGYELRKTNTWNASYFSPDVLGASSLSGKSPFHYVWGDYTLCPDLVLSNASGNTNAANTVKSLIEAPYVSNVAGKTVTIDGTMNTTEGWCAAPFALLDKTVASTPTKVTSNISNVKVSADTNNLYIGLESYNLASTSAKLHVAFGKNSTGFYGANDKNNFVTVELDLQDTANPIESLKYGSNSYASGDALYATTAAVSRSSDKVTAEVKIPIPESLIDLRITNNLVFGLGAVEVFPANAGATGYTVSEANGAEKAVISMIMPLIANPEFENLPQWIESTKQTANYATLKNITVATIGDQYLTGGTLGTDYVWSSLLATKYEWNYIINAETGSFMSESSLDTSETNSIHKIWRKLPKAEPNVVIISGGHQDIRAGLPIGNIDSTDTKTFMGALNTLFDKMRDKYPDAMFVYTTTWNIPTTETSGFYFKSYADAAEQVCNAQGVYFFKAYDKTVSGVDMADPSFVSEYVMDGADYDCLNLNGMKLVMAKYEKFIADSLSDWTVNKSTILAARPTLNYGSKNTGSSTDNGNDSTETKAPETNAPETEAAPATEEKKKGCKSYVGASALVILTTACASGAVLGKRHKRKDD